MYTDESNKSREVKRKEIEMEDTCPVCLESLLVASTTDNESMPLSYCKRGCGKNVHVAVSVSLKNNLFFVVLSLLFFKKYLYTCQI